jgi:predicted Abi (CAAX) family protease
MLPRWAHDEIATIFLKQGASLWFIRTNQVGGFDPDIQPKAPTAILGHRTH